MGYSKINLAELNYKFSESIELLKKTAINSTIIHKHAAALIQNDHIYSYAYNDFIKKIKPKTENKTIHAEINLFYKYPKKNVKGMDILVIRINNTNTFLKNSRPCNSCIDKLQEIGIRKVYYSNALGNIVCEYVQHMEKLHISSRSKYVLDKT